MERTNLYSDIRGIILKKVKLEVLELFVIDGVNVRSSFQKHGMVVLRVRYHDLVHSMLNFAWIKHDNYVPAVAMEKVGTLGFIMVDDKLGHLRVDHARLLIPAILLEHEAPREAR